MLSESLYCSCERLGNIIISRHRDVKGIAVLIFQYFYQKKFMTELQIQTGTSYSSGDRNHIQIFWF